MGRDCSIHGYRCSCSFASHEGIWRSGDKIHLSLTLALIGGELSASLTKPWPSRKTPIPMKLERHLLKKRQMYDHSRLETFQDKQIIFEIPESPWMISGFQCTTDKICTLLRYYAVLSCDFFFLVSWPLKMWLRGCPETLYVITIQCCIISLKSTDLFWHSLWVL